MVALMSHTDMPCGRTYEALVIEEPGFSRVVDDALYSWLKQYFSDMTGIKSLLEPEKENER